MSEIVYTHLNQLPPVFDEHSNLRQAGDQKVTIFQSPNKVAFVLSRQQVGKPTRREEDKDKRWYRWVTTRSVGFRRNSAGNVVPYDASRPWDFKVGMGWKHTKPIEAFSMLDAGGTEANDAFKFACYQSFGIKSMYDLYPMAREYGLINYQSIPNNIRLSMRQTNWGDFAASVFGSKRSSDMLRYCVEHTDPFIVSLAYEFRGLVDDKTLIQFMHDNHFDDEMEESFQPFTPYVRKVVSKMNEASRNAILQRGIDNVDLRRLALIKREHKHLINKVDDVSFFSSWSDVVR